MSVKGGEIIDGNQIAPLALEISAVDDTKEEVDPNQLSVSPRDRLSYVADRKEVRAIETFDDHGQLRLMQRLIMLFRLETIKQQPNDIIDFGCEFFSPHNRELLRGMLDEDSMTTPFATPFIQPLNMPSNRPYNNRSTNQQTSHEAAT